MGGRASILIVLAACALACGKGSADPAPTNVVITPDAGLPSCAEGSIASPGGTACHRVGVADCGVGATADGKGGCIATLPPTPCAAGKMAVPGETTCRDVAPCGTGTWGDVPVDASTVYVDAAYAGGDGDGSRAKPFPKIAPALAKATKVVAIAAGNYAENLLIDGRLQLWGRCPSMVTIAGVDKDALATITISNLPAELHRLSVTGPTLGVATKNARGVVLDELWVHHAAAGGVASNAGSVTLSRSLIESNGAIGVSAAFGGFDLDQVVVRDTQPGPDEKLGRGVGARRAPMTIKRSLFERNRQFGLVMQGLVATLEDSVVRDTRAELFDGTYGTGLYAFADGKVAADVTLLRTIVEGNREVGVLTYGAKLSLTDSVVRDTAPQEVGKEFGRGIACEFDDVSMAPSEVRLLRSVVERNHEVGISLDGCTGALEDSIVRDTYTAASDQTGGRGIAATVDSTTGRAAELTLKRSLVARSVDIGVALFGARCTIEDSVVSDTRGRADGLFGDGVSSSVLQNAAGREFPSDLHLLRSAVTRSARAGALVIGSHLVLEEAWVTCSQFDIDQETFDALEPSLEDRGRNVCGCETQTTCRAVSAGLARPAPAPFE